MKPNKSSVLVGLGNNAYATHDLQQALRYYTLAYESDTKSQCASYNLSLVYAALGDVANAAHYQRIADPLLTSFSSKIVIRWPRTPRQFTLRQQIWSD